MCLFMYVVCRCSYIIGGVIFNFALQNYCFFLTYARKTAPKDVFFDG